MVKHLSGPLLFLVYINDLPDGINSLCKIFTDDTYLFSKVYDINSDMDSQVIGQELIIPSTSTKNVQRDSLLRLLL